MNYIKTVFYINKSNGVQKRISLKDVIEREKNEMISSQSSDVQELPSVGTVK